jgi:2,3-dihydroxyethylbenzene 1,2-dioxygenase
MSAVTELGYVGLDCSDLEAWQTFATEVVGMEWVEGPERDRAFLRMDAWHHRLVLHRSKADDLAYVGWRTSNEESLHALAERLAAAGFECRTGTDAEAEERRVMGLVKTRTPGGIATEIFWGPQIDAHLPFHPGRRMFGRFRAGDAGLGHIAIREPDGPAAFRFYRLLGLKGNRQYKLTLPNGFVAKPFFMHCNDRQHSLQFDLGPMPKAINHLCIEYTDLNDVGYAHDLIRKRGIDVALDIGKHANDQAVSFYAGNPSKWVWELSWGCRKPPAHDEHYIWDIYGHEVEATGYGLEIKTTL